jgi:hypothetical protein
LSTVVYAPDTLLPYTATTSDGSTLPSPIPLGEVAVELPKIVLRTPLPKASFDYIDLIDVGLPTTPLPPGTSIETTWTWRPQPSDYRDHYRATLQLKDDQSRLRPLADFDLGGDSYPSSRWPANYPLQQRVTLTLPEPLLPGAYQVLLSLTRASDGKAIGARLPFRLRQQPNVEVGTLEISGE